MIPEDKSSSQEPLKNDTPKSVQASQKATDFIKANASWGSLVLLIIINAAISLLTVVADGQDGIKEMYSYSAIQWILWNARIIVPAIIAWLMCGICMREGLKVAFCKPDVKIIIDEYIEKKAKTKEERFTSPRRYQTITMSKAAVTKAIIALSVNTLFTLLSIHFSPLAVVAAFIQMGLAIAFGFIEFNKAYTYGTTDAVLFFKHEIERFKEQECSHSTEKNLET